MMRKLDLVKSRKGIAMVLAVSLVGLLSLFGVWMIQESTISHRITAALVRKSMSFNMAEGALDLAELCLENEEIPLTFNELMSSGEALKIEDTGDRTLPNYIKSPAADAVPEIYYMDFSTTPPPGWSLNHQAYSGFYTVYYLAVGRGSTASRQGDAQTAVMAFSERTLR